MGTSPLEPGHVVAGRYRVVEKIGEGGMGLVYLVHHVHTDERLALKVLHKQVLADEAAVQRFRREARAPAKIASDHVARVTDADTADDLDGAPFYVMELLEGADLEHVVRERGTLSPEEVVEYLRQTARALDKAHAMGIVHRDLKPENLFLATREDGTPCVKLLDFGIARMASGEGPAHLKTQAGLIFGTPAYMSPEQMEGAVDRIGPASDIWAIGLIAFRLLCGAEFWTGTTLAVLCAQVLSIPMPSPTDRGSTLGPEFDAWFARCVARPPEDRFETAGAAVIALAAALGVHMETGRATALSLVDTGAGAPPAMAATMAPTHPSLVGTMAPTSQSGPSQGGRGRILAVIAAVVGLGGAAAALTLGGVVDDGSGSGAAVATFDPTSGPGADAPAVVVPTTDEPVVATSPVSSADVSASASASAPPGPTARPPAPRGSAPAAPTTTGRAEGPAAPAETKPKGGAPSSDQRARLAALDRLCAQRIYTPSECAAKRRAIQGSP